MTPVAIYSVGPCVDGRTRECIGTHHKGGQADELGRGGELGGFQHSNLGFQAIHAALQHGEFLLELLHQPLELVGHFGDPVEASVQQGGRFPAGHRTAAAVGAVGVASHTAVALDQVAQCLISPVGGLHIGELGDRGDLVGTGAVLANTSEIEAVALCSGNAKVAAQGSRNKQGSGRGCGQARTQGRHGEEAPGTVRAIIPHISSMSASKEG